MDELDLGYAKLDLSRPARQGFGEVIYGAGKTAEQIIGILQGFASKDAKNVLITRLSAEKAEIVQQSVPHVTYHDIADIAVAFPAPTEKTGLIVVCAAGTSDIPVAEEAALTAETMGSDVERLYDVGVAGLHRLLSRLDLLRKAQCVVAVAGMEGALASVVGGLVACPVIAVPTSIGYGANFAGMSALLSMLNSCAAGVSVVNIDNGFGAGYQAALINKRPA